MGGEHGVAKLAPRRLEQRVADLQAEFGASGIAHDRLLAERADHVERNRTDAPRHARRD